MSQDQELHDLGDAVGLAVDRLIEPVEGMHRVISGRAFKYAGPPAVPVRAVHDTMVGGVYESIRFATGALAQFAGDLLSRRNPDANPVSDSPSASRVQAAFNAVLGDRLAERGNALAVTMSVRAGNHFVGIDEDSLAAAFPTATDHIVILLHGLGQTEHCFAVPEGESGLVERARDAGFTPVGVRYNSGLPIADSGERLAWLLDGLVDAWPVADAQVSLVGYSMGGLVARAALGVGVRAGHGWVGHTEHVVTVGAPHHGSLVAKGVRVASRGLGLARTTRPLSDFLDGRSGGICDLEEGDGVATGWEDEAAVRHHFVAAVITPDHAHPVGAAVGDLVVRVSSATGRSITTENVHVIGRRRHFDLLSEPEVTRQVVDWLSIPRL